MAKSCILRTHDSYRAKMAQHVFLLGLAATPSGNSPPHPTLVPGASINHASHFEVGPSASIWAANSSGGRILYYMNRCWNVEEVLKQLNIYMYICIYLSWFINLWCIVGCSCGVLWSCWLHSWKCLFWFCHHGVDSSLVLDGLHASCFKSNDNHFYLSDVYWSLFSYIYCVFF